MDIPSKVVNLIKWGLYILLIAIVLYFLFAHQYKKGLSDGKNDPAVKAEVLNQKTAEIRTEIKEAVVLVHRKFEERGAELAELEAANQIQIPEEELLEIRVTDPEQGISDEMFLALNKAREDANQ